MKEYKMSAELLQAIINVLEGTPAKVSFQVLKRLEVLVLEQADKPEPKVEVPNV